MSQTTAKAARDLERLKLVSLGVARAKTKLDLLETMNKQGIGVNQVEGVERSMRRAKLSKGRGRRGRGGEGREK